MFIDRLSYKLIIILKKLTKQDIIEKREWIFELLNDENAETPCKGCSMVVEKPFKDVRFDLLGHMDLAATTTCNLRCNFCGSRICMETGCTMPACC